MSRDPRVWLARAEEARRRNEPASAAVYERLAEQCERKVTP
jgi:hypothetical protein